MADPIGISFHLTDDDGRTATTLLYLPSVTSYANAQTYATAFSKLLDDAVGPRVDNISISFGGTLHAGVKAAPIANSPMFSAGLLTHNVFGYSRGFTFVVPGLLESLLSGEDGIASGDALLLAIQAALHTGIDIGGGVFIEPVNPFERDVTAFRSGKRSNRKF